MRIEKMLKSIGVVVCISGMSLLASCHKDDPQPTKTELLTRSWSIVKGTVSGIEVPDFELACVKDNLWIFSKGGAFNEDEGATKCDPTDPQSIETGKWALANNDTLLKVTDVAGDETDFTIGVLSSTTLGLTFTEVLNGISVQVSLTLAPK